MKNSLTIIIVSILFVILNSVMIGCGADSCASNPNQAACTSDGQSTTSSTTATTSKSPMGVVGSYLVYEGYVSPLNLIVNDVNYVDSEDFYTHEIERLRADADKNYPDYELSLDANIGLKDFKKSMSVFLVASNDVGVASESIVDSSGKFSFNFPSDNVAKEDLYTIRAVKRVSVSLIKGQEEVKLCYNLYGEAEVTLTKSVILRKFATTPTEYNCKVSDTTSGIQLPAKKNPAASNVAAPAASDTPAVEDNTDDQTVVNDQPVADAPISSSRGVVSSSNPTGKKP